MTTIPRRTSRRRTRARTSRRRPTCRSLRPARSIRRRSSSTNLLPGDADHVFHGYFANVFSFTGMLRTIIFGEPGTLVDASLKERLGFSPLAVDDLIRADRFSDPGWVYVVVHLNEYVDEKALIAALDLKKQPAIGKHTYWKAERRNATLACLDRLAVGAPSLARALTPPDNQPLAVHIYDKQTILFADEPPLKEFLRNDRKFAAQSAVVAEGPAAEADPNSLVGTIWDGTETRQRRRDQAEVHLPRRGRRRPRIVDRHVGRVVRAERHQGRARLRPGHLSRLGRRRQAVGPGPGRGQQHLDLRRQPAPAGCRGPRRRRRRKASSPPGRTARSTRA